VRARRQRSESRIDARRSAGRHQRAHSRPGRTRSHLRAQTMTTFISRRDLLKRAGALAAVPVARDVARGFQPSDDPVARGFEPDVRRESLEHLTAAEAGILDAVVARLIPSDEYGPGAKEARAVHYIDRALGGALSSSRQAYASGLAALDTYARASR